MANRLHQPHVPLPEIHWSPNEQWVWRKLRRGERADFNERYGVKLVAWEEDAWNEKEKARRLIRPEFIYTILLHEPWRGALSNWGVRLRGAYFAERIRMPYAKVALSFRLRGCRMEKGLSLYGARLDHRLALEGCWVKNRANLKALHIGGNLVLDGSRLNETDLTGAHLEGKFSANQAYFRGKLVMGRAEIQEGLFMRDVTFVEKCYADIIFTNIGGNLHFELAKFQALDLTGTHAQAVVDNGMEWPKKLNLDHFTYQHLGGLGEGGVHMLDRPASWFTGWLAKHKPYSPQPYEQCAKVLQEAGQPGKAMEILYQAKERERNEPNGDFRRWVWLTASKWLLGHGLTWRFALVPAAWAVGVLLLGWLVFCQTTTLMEDHSAWWGLGYSLSKLIPLVSFGKDISELGVSSFAARAWFTFQTLFGWFLASLIVAGLAGVGRPGGKS